MTQEEARSLRAAHDIEARRLSRMKVAELKNLHRIELAKKGAELLYGGPASRNEFVRAILDMQFPRAAMELSTHVLYHETDGWTACQYCHPHSGARCECGLAASGVARLS